MLRKGFTLIELLVVMVLIVVIMGLVMPKGAKMLSSFEKSVQKTKDIQRVSKESSLAFLSSTEKTVKVLDIKYHISKKGVISKDEKSDDNY